jgi:hypothetical protein
LLAVKFYEENIMIRKLMLVLVILALATPVCMAAAQDGGFPPECLVQVYSPRQQALLWQMMLTGGEEERVAYEAYMATPFCPDLVFEAEDAGEHAQAADLAYYLFAQTGEGFWQTRAAADFWLAGDEEAALANAPLQFEQHPKLMLASAVYMVDPNQALSWVHESREGAGRPLSSQEWTLSEKIKAQALYAQAYNAEDEQEAVLLAARGYEALQAYVTQMGGVWNLRYAELFWLQGKFDSNQLNQRAQVEAEMIGKATTPKELALAEFLLANTRWVQSSMQPTQEVWLLLISSAIHDPNGQGYGMLVAELRRMDPASGNLASLLGAFMFPGQPRPQFILAETAQSVPELVPLALSRIQPWLPQTKGG